MSPECDPTPSFSSSMKTTPETSPEQLMKLAQSDSACKSSRALSGTRERLFTQPISKSSVNWSDISESQERPLTQSDLKSSTTLSGHRDMIRKSSISSEMSQAWAESLQKELLSGSFDETVPDEPPRSLSSPELQDTLQDYRVWLNGHDSPSPTSSEGNVDVNGDSNGVMNFKAHDEQNDKIHIDHSPWLRGGTNGHQDVGTNGVSNGNSNADVNETQPGQALRLLLGMKSKASAGSNEPRVDSLQHPVPESSSQPTGAQGLRRALSRGSLNLGDHRITPSPTINCRNPQVTKSDPAQSPTHGQSSRVCESRFQDAGMQPTSCLRRRPMSYHELAEPLSQTTRAPESSQATSCISHTTSCESHVAESRTS